MCQKQHESARISQHATECDWHSLCILVKLSYDLLMSILPPPLSLCSLESLLFTIAFFSLCNSEVIAVQNAARMFNSPDSPGNTKSTFFYSLNRLLIREWQWKRKAQCKGGDIALGDQTKLGSRGEDLAISFVTEIPSNRLYINLCSPEIVKLWI